MPLYWAPPLALPCKLISSSSTMSLWVVHSLVTSSPGYSTTTISTSLQKPQLHLIPLATCRLLKYYHHFMSRSFTGSYQTLCAFLSLLLSVFVLYPVSITIKLHALRRQWLLACCVGCTSNVSQVFLLTLPTQCSRLPWNVAESSETSCCVH